MTTTSRIRNHRHHHQQPQGLDRVKLRSLLLFLSTLLVTLSLLQTYKTLRTSTAIAKSSSLRRESDSFRPPVSRNRIAEQPQRQLSTEEEEEDGETSDEDDEAADGGDDDVLEILNEVEEEVEFEQVPNQPTHMTAAQLDKLDEDHYDFTKFQTTSKHPPWALFYNVYVPGDPKERRGALAIIEEQLGQIAASFAAQAYGNRTTLQVFYNSIGPAGPPPSSYMFYICQVKYTNLQCIHMKHYEQAFEEVTLQRVHEYCTAHPLHHKVIYMHSKGSYNSRAGKNQHWRRHMTHAVSHKDCLQPPDASCNVCGLVFNPQPWIHFSGNFFTADCGYVSKLLPLPQYRKGMLHLANVTRAYMQQKRFLFFLFPDKDAYLGLERYASEHWPGSHPSIKPCDLSIDRNINVWKKNRGGGAGLLLQQPNDPKAILNVAATVEPHLSFRLAPRMPIEEHGLAVMPGNLRYDDSRRLREYWLLAGNLFKWMGLYNGSIPERTSWVWDYFPDGHLFYEAHERYGPERVLAKLLDPYAREHDGLVDVPGRWEDNNKQPVVVSMPPPLKKMTHADAPPPRQDAAIEVSFKMKKRKMKTGRKQHFKAAVALRR